VCRCSLIKRRHPVPWFLLEREKERERERKRERERERERERGEAEGGKLDS